MADELRTTLLGAKHLNDLVAFGLQRYKESFTRNIKNAMQSGYLPFTQPLKGQERQDFLLSQQASQQALQMMLNPESDAAEREQGVQLLRDIQEARNGQPANTQEGTHEGEQSDTR